MAVGGDGGAVMPMMRWVLWLLGALVRDGGAVMPMMRWVLWLLGALVRDGGADDARGSVAVGGSCERWRAVIPMMLCA